MVCAPDSSPRHLTIFILIISPARICFADERDWIDLSFIPRLILIHCNIGCIDIAPGVIIVTGTSHKLQF